ncbi:MAG: RNA polymerase sigma factor [Verrucomicrobiales bacterium]
MSSGGKEQRDELQLIAAWTKDRDQAAARELIDVLHPRVAGIVRRHWARPEDWEDLEQEVMVRVFENLPKFKANAPLEHWVSRIALNACRQRWRKKSRRPEWRWSDLSEGEQRAFDQAQHSEVAIEELEGRDARALMLRLLDTLGAEDRLVLSLLHLEERSVAEIAELTGKSASAVKVRAFRARKKLHAALERLEKEGDFR